MLNRSQTKFLLLTSCAQQSNSNNPFFGMPKEIIQRIKYSPTPDSDFLAALKEVAYAQLEPLRAKLEQAKNDQANPATLKNLLLQAGDVMTPAGLLVKNTTLLECAICAGDPDMVVMIKSYFLAFKEGEDELVMQLEHCQPALSELQTQKPDDLTWLIEVILASKLEDVREELKTGDEYDWNYSSPLRDALNKFRQEKLKSNRIITTPKMHCNYQNLIQAYEILNTYWEKLKVNNSHDKHDLFARQVIGFIHLTELTSLDRRLFAQGEVEAAAEGKSTSRLLKYCQDEGSFPDFDLSSINSHVGLGFNFFVSLCGCARVCVNVRRGRARHVLQNLCRTKTSNLQSLCSTLCDKSSVYNSLT